MSRLDQQRWAQAGTPGHLAYMLQRTVGTARRRGLTLDQVIVELDAILAAMREEAELDDE